MSKCISQHGEYSEHQVTDGVCDYCGAVDEDALITGLREIQELHPIEETGVEANGVKEVYCPTCRDHAPCETRWAADKALGETK